jgi:hypothetical protein
MAHLEPGDNRPGVAQAQEAFQRAGQAATSSRTGRVALLQVRPAQGRHDT